MEPEKKYRCKDWETCGYRCGHSKPHEAWDYGMNNEFNCRDQKPCWKGQDHDGNLLPCICEEI